MTKVLFYRENGVFYGFEEHGHAGYGEFDNDIVCAALSSMTFLIINTIELAYSSDVEFTMEDDDADIMVRAKAALPQFEADERKRYAISGLFSVGLALFLRTMLYAAWKILFLLNTILLSPFFCDFFEIFT